MPRKTKSQQLMEEFADELRAAGYRVLKGTWPDSLDEEARWDFLQTRHAVWPMSQSGRDHFNAIKAAREGRS